MGRSPCVLTFLTGLPQIPVSTIAFTWSLGLVKLIPLLHQHVPHHYILIECVTYCSKTTTSLRHVSLPWHLIDHLKSSSLVASTVRAWVQRALFPLSWWRFNVFLKDTSTEWSLCTRTDWSCSRWTSSSSLSFYFFFFFLSSLIFHQSTISDILCLTQGQSIERILKKLSHECPGTHTVQVVNYMEGHECGSNIIRQTVCSHAGSSLRRWGSVLASTSTSALFIYVAPFIQECSPKCFTYVYILYKAKSQDIKTENWVTEK